MTPVGLTGGIASGKTKPFCRLLEAKACTIVDADVVAHRLLLGGGRHTSGGQSFRKGILGDAGEIDRGKLGEEVFGNRSKLDQLNLLLHPLVIRTIGKCWKPSRRSAMHESSSMRR